MQKIGSPAGGSVAIDPLLTACGQAFSHPIARYAVRPVLLAGLASIMAGFIAYYALALYRYITEPRQSLISYIDATVARPAVFRVLVPSLLRGLYSVTPAYLFDFFEDIERSHPRHGFRFFVASINGVSTHILP
ncbi:MAG: hypothetical protein JWM91_3758 [Rhodospirillales bacterium]|nr:hypothetical protein [Rhodospirillales bacterium]